MELYGYYRSSAAYRVRIALNLKSLECSHHPVHLRHREQNSPAYRAVNPQGLVPTLVTDSGEHLSQSLAIIEYLDELEPEPALLPADPLARARVRQMALIIACDIHPLNNFTVLVTLKGMGIDDAARDTWYRTNIERGFPALEALAATHGDGFCFGDSPTLADICLVPQLYNARRFACELDAFPRLLDIDARCRALPAFQAAAPENQPDAE